MLIYLPLPPATEEFRNTIDLMKPYFTIREVLQMFFYSEYYSQGSYEEFNHWKDRMIERKMSMESIRSKSIMDKALKDAYNLLKAFYGTELIETGLRSSGSDNFLIDLSYSGCAVILKTNPLPF